MNKVKYAAWLYALYFFFRLVIEKLTYILAAFLALYAIVQTVFFPEMFSVYDAIKIYNSSQTELKAAFVSSSMTIIGVFLSILYAARQLKTDGNNKRKADLAGNLVYVMHDMAQAVTEIRLFFELTRDLLIKAVDSDGFENLHFEYKYWRNRRNEISKIEERLWGMWHEFNRWTAIGKRHLSVLGLSNITDRIAHISSNIKIKSSVTNIYSNDDIPPDLDATLQNINIYCIDVNIDICKRANVYISANMGRINDLLLNDVKEYTLKELIFIIRAAEDMRNLLQTMQTGETTPIGKIIGAYNKMQNIR